MSHTRLKISSALLAVASVRGIRSVNAAPRGIQSMAGADSPAAMMGALATAFEEFRDRNDAKLSEIESNLADVATRAASRGLNAGGSDEHGPDRGTVNAAFRDYLKSGTVNGLGALVNPSAAMSVGSDPEGGYAVYPTFSTGITKRVFETSPLRNYARVVQISTDSFTELVDLNEPAAAWVGETQSRPETGTPNLASMNIPVHEMYAMPKVTQKLLDDAQFDIADWLITKVSEKLGRQETSAFYTGNGVLKPRGFLTYPTAATGDATRPWGTLEHVITGSDGTFGTTTNGMDKLIDLQSSLKTEYRKNAIWQMNRRTAAAIRKMKDGQGNFIWVPSILAGQPDMLLGHPVEIAEDMPDMETGSLSVAFGDFGAGYTIVDRIGDRVLRDALTQKPYTLFYTYRRVGGDVNNFEAIKLLKFSAA